MPSIPRRKFAVRLASLCLSSTLRPFAAAQSAHPKTRLILLGTAGGPRPRKTRVPSSQVVLVNDAAYFHFLRVIHKPLNDELQKFLISLSHDSSI